MEEEEEELVVEGEVEVCSNDCLHNHRATKKNMKKNMRPFVVYHWRVGVDRFEGGGVTKCLEETEGKVPVRDNWHVTALDGRIK